MANKEKEYLNEEKYQKTSKVLTIIGIIIIIAGIIGALCLSTNIKTDTEKETDKKKLSELGLELEKKRDALETKGVEESSNYRDGEAHDLYLINIALRPDLQKCEYAGSYYDNDLTRDYCKLKAEIADDNNAINGGIDLFVLGPIIAVLMVSLTLGLMFIMVGKRRAITAFAVQSNMPIAKEGIDKMTPTVGKVAKHIAKEASEGFSEGKKKAL